MTSIPENAMKGKTHIGYVYKKYISDQLEDAIEYHELLKGLNNSSTIRIIKCLSSDKPARTEDISQALSISEPFILRKLLALRKLKIVSVEKKGIKVFYYLNPVFIKIAIDKSEKDPYVRKIKKFIPERIQMEMESIKKEKEKAKKEKERQKRERRKEREGL